MPRRPKPQGQRGLRMWNPNPKRPQLIKIEKKLEGCTPCMILDLNACNNCPKKIKHWRLESGRGGYDNGDSISGYVFVGYPTLPDLYKRPEHIKTIQDDDCCFIKAWPEISEYTHGHGLLPHKWFLANGNKILDKEQFEVVNCPVFDKHVKYTETHPRGPTFDYRYEFPKWYDRLADWVGYNYFFSIDNDCFYMKYCLKIKMPYLRTYLWNAFLYLSMIPFALPYMILNLEAPRWLSWIFKKFEKELNAKDYYKEE